MLSTLLSRVPLSLWLAAALAAALGVQTLRLGNAQEAAEKAALELQTARAEHNSTKTALEASQAAVSAMQTRAAALEKAASRARIAARQLQGRANARAAEILTSPTPDSCSSAIAFLVEDARRPQ